MTFAEETPCTLKYNSKGEQPQCNGPEHKTKLQNLKTFSFQSSFFIAYSTVILLRGLGLIESYIATCLILGEIQMLLKCVERIKRKMILMQRCSLKDNVRKIFLRKEIGSFDLEVCWQKSVSEKFSFSFEKRINHFDTRSHFRFSFQKLSHFEVMANHYKSFIRNSYFKQEIKKLTFIKLIR